MARQFYTLSWHKIIHSLARKGTDGDISPPIGIFYLLRIMLPASGPRRALENHTLNNTRKQLTTYALRRVVPREPEGSRLESKNQVRGRLPAKKKIEQVPRDSLVELAKGARVIRDNQFGTVDAKRFIKNFVREVVGEKDLACIVCVCVKQAVK